MCEYTAQEIAQALRECESDEQCCANCPMECSADCEALEINAADMIDALLEALDKAKAERDELAAALKSARRERDAAVADLRYVAACETCKEYRRSALTEPCLHCTKYGLLDSENKYEWRGLCKENGGKTDADAAQPIP